MPHDKLGEEVAAAIVLREGLSATEREIRDFGATQLADFKVPRKVVILDEIPKGATGKLQRIGLAAKLGFGLMQGDGTVAGPSSARVRTPTPAPPHKGEGLRCAGPAAPPPVGRD